MQDGTSRDQRPERRPEPPVGHTRARHLSSLAQKVRKDEPGEREGKGRPYGSSVEEGER